MRTPESSPSLGNFRHQLNVKPMKKEGRRVFTFSSRHATLRSTRSTLPQSTTLLVQRLDPPQASSFTFYWSSSILTHSYSFLVYDASELYVLSTAFDEECAVRSKEISKGLLSDDGSSGYSSDHSSLWEEDPPSSISSIPHNVSKLEAHLYYFGIRGPRRWGPKLIFRTSKDVFRAPSGPGQDVRLKQLRPVYEHHKLGKDNLWCTVRSAVRDLLEAQQSAD